MDKKLLDSLSNLSLALEGIAAALKDKSEAQSATAKAMKDGDFVKEIKEINIGVKALQKDTKQILANQQTIIGMAKSKSDKKENVAEGLGKDKTAQKNFKEGLGVILLIAVAVLAIGVAFLLIGKVNFLSVIALSIALPLLAIGFAKVHKILKEVGFDPKKDAANFIIAITAISVGLTASSWILSMITPLSFSKFFTATFIALTFAMLGPSIYKFLMAFKEMSWSQLIKSVVGFAIILPAIALGIAFASWAFQLIKPIGFSQFLTAVGIGIVFAIISFGIRKLLKSFKGIGVKDLMEAVIFLPLILPAIALGIAGASYAFQLIKPIGFVQFLTAVGIAVVFAVISYGIRKLLKSFEGLSPANLIVASLMMPIVLVAVSYAIAYSSVALGKIKPISFSQFITAVGVAAVFVVISYGIAKIIKGVSEMKWSDVPKIPVFMVIVAIAITASSYILSMIKVMPVATLLNIVLYGITLAIVAASVGGVIALFSKMKVGIKDAIMGTLIIVVIATAIMLSSHILSMAKVIPVATLFRLVLYGITLAAVVAAIGGTMALLDKLKVSPVSAIKGAILIVIIATAIMLSSHILSLGNYKKYPDWKWSLGVGLALIAFAPAIVLLGAIAMSGIGALAILAGAGMVLVVAGTITAASYILSKGKYGNYPPLSWSASVAISMAAFTAGMVVLGALIIGTFGLGGLMLAAGSKAVLTVADTIVKASYILEKGKYTGGPTLAWAGGIALALGAFAPVYGMMMANSILSLFGGGGVGPDDFAKAIRTISQGIVDAAGFFANNSSAFVKGPSKEWAEGVGTAIGAFSPVYKVLADNSGWMASGVSVEDMAKAIMTISQGIVDSAKFFAENKSPFTEGNYPSKSWGEGVGAALGAFAPVFKAMNEDRGWFESGDDVLQGMLNGISYTTKALISSAKAFFKAGNIWGSYPSENWANGVKSTITSFMDIFKTIEDKGYSVASFTNYTNILSGSLNSISTSARTLWLNQKFFSFKMDPNYIPNLSKNVLAYGSLSRMLDSILTVEEKKTISLGAFGDVSFKTKKSVEVSNINKVIGQMIISAGVLYGNRSVFGFKMDPNYVSSLTKNVLAYGSLSRMLDSILTVEEKKTISLGLLGDFSFKTKKSVEVSNINKVIGQMIISAGILYGNRSVFGFKMDPNYVSSLTKNVLAYGSLSRMIDSKVSNINKVIDEMITSSNVIYKNRLVFGFKMDPNYVSSLVKNVLAYGLLSRVLGSIKASNINKVIGEMITSANVIYKNRLVFGFKMDPNYVSSLYKNVLTYGLLSRMIDSKVSNINKVIGEMITSANVIYKNRLVFGFKMDPNYVSSLYKNVLTYGLLSRMIDSKVSNINKVIGEMITSANVIYKNRLVFGFKMDPNYVSSLTKNVLNYGSLSRVLDSIKSSSINKVIGEMVTSSNAIYKNRLVFGFKMDPNYVSSLTKNVLNYGSLSRVLDSIKSSSINKVIGEMITSANVIYKNRLVFGFKMDPNYISSLVKNVLTYGSLSRILDSKVSNINKVIGEMVTSSNAIYKNRLVFGFKMDPNYIPNLSKNILAYASLSKMIDSKVSNINKVIGEMVISAGNIYRNRLVFGFKMDPNYIPNLSKNILAYASLSKMIDSIKASNINKVISEMIITAGNIYRNRTVFGFKMDPEYVSSLNKNVLAYGSLSKNIDLKVSNINKIIDEIIISAKSIYKNRLVFGFKMDPEYVSSLNKNVLAYGSLSKNIDSKVSNINKVIGEMIISAKSIYRNRLVFGFKMDPNYIPNLSKNVLAYGSLSRILDSKVSNINKVIGEMIISAGNIYRNRLVFGFKMDPNYIPNLSKNVLTYASLSKMIDSKVSNINKVIGEMVISAGNIYRNRSVFGFKVDPNYILNLSKNVLTYDTLSKMIDSVKVSNINKVIGEMVISAKSIYKNRSVFGFKMDPNYISSLVKNVLTYGSLSKMIDSKASDINKIIGEMVISAKAIYRNRLVFGFKIDPSYVSSLVKNVLAYSSLSRMMGSVKFSNINKVIGEMVTSANVIYRNRLLFGFKMNPNYMKGISSNVMAFDNLSNSLDKKQKSQSALDNISKVAKGIVKTASEFFKAGNIWGSYPSEDWANGVKSTITSFMGIFKTIKDRGYNLASFRNYTNILSGALSSISTSARTLWSNQKFFSFKINESYIPNLAKNVLAYGSLSRMLDSILTVEEKKTISLGSFGDFSFKTKKSVEVSNINKVINQMAISAGILYRNRLLFGFKIDPNYMKAIASNVMTFADLANNLGKKQKGQSAIDQMLGLDPISRVAKGMVKIANAYDTLAKAVKNFSGAINGLNVGKLQEFRVLTGNLAMLSAMDSNMFSNMLKVLESRSGVFANMLQIQTAELGKRPAVKAGPGAVQSKKSDESYLKDAKGETQLQKLDKIYQVLVILKNEAMGINEFLHNPKEENKDMGSKGDG